MFNFTDARLTGIFAGMFRNGALEATSAGAARHDIAPMVIERDPTTRRITRIETQPHDTPEALLFIERLLRNEAQLSASSQPFSDKGIAENEATAGELDVAPTVPRGNEASASTQGNNEDSRWLSEAIELYGQQMIRSSKLSSSTVRYTHLPSLRLFRELVSEHRRFDDPTGTPGVWDLRVAELTPARIDAFLEMFWRFPSRQGKRPNLADAKQVLAEGGEPQSHDNTIKRIVHIKRLLSWLCDRGDLSKSVLGPLRAELEGTPRSSRESAPVDDLDLGEADDEDGYVAFTVEDIDKIFDRDVYSAHAARNAARYFIPLLGRFTAARLNEIAQATVKDVRQIRGIHCLCVTAKERDAHGAVRSVQQSKKRVKSKAGRRTIPLHPELIRLGFLEYVAQRMASEERFLFDLKWLEKDGFGKYPGRDFRRLTEFVGVWERRRKVFHSFRSTLAQELERHGLQETLIQRVLGHAVRTTRIKHYSRNSDGSTVPLQIVLDALCKVPGLPVFPTWNEVRTASRLQLRLVANDSRFCIREDQTGSGQGQAKPAEADGLDSWNTALRHGKSCR